MPAQIITLQFPQPKKRISVVMVSYMTGPALQEAVRAVVNDPDIFELILVDNGNTEPARLRLNDYIVKHDRIRILQGHGNIGFACGCNYGAKLARGDHFLFLNPDAIIERGAARKLADAGELRAEPWIAGGMLRDIFGREQRGARRGAVTPVSAIVSFTPLHRLTALKSIHRENEPMPKATETMPVVSGACLMMSRESFDKLGGFDENYFLHVEDIDVCRRAWKAGGDVIFVPSAQVMHYGSTSLARPQDVEGWKLYGFIRYFWNYSDKWWARLLTALAIPFMCAGIMGRAWYLAIRKAIRGG